MSDEDVSAHYARTGLLAAVRDGLARLGKTPATVMVDDLAPVDEFHIGGRQASEDFLGQLGLTPDQRVLDIGCGLGGSVRPSSSPRLSATVAISPWSSSRSSRPERPEPVALRRSAFTSSWATPRLASSPTWSPTSRAVPLLRWRWSLGRRRSRGVPDNRLEKRGQLVVWIQVSPGPARHAGRAGGRFRRRGRQVQ